MATTNVLHDVNGIYHRAESGVGGDSSVNQLASWMIENPCVAPSVDDNGNQTNASSPSENFMNMADVQDELELSPFSFHSHVS